MKRILVYLSLCVLASAAFAGVEQTVDELVSKLGEAKVQERYNVQMELQALAAKASRPGAEAERAALARVLAAKVADSRVAQPARVWIVRQFEYIGADESVPALTALLNGQDPELKECARRALEKNSAPAAAESLRAALEKAGETTWKIGLIQSLGEHGDGKAVKLLAQSLNRPDTSSAAASALAKIADEPAVQALWAAFEKQAATAPDALVSAANRLLRKGEAERAKAIYAKLYKGCDSARLRGAALIGLAKADPAGTKELVVQTLLANDVKLQEVAVTAARQVYGDKASGVLADLLPKLNVPGKVCVLRALDASAEKQVIAISDDPDQAVRSAALENLGRIGGSASVPVLLKAAVEGPSGTGKAAAAALARISGPGADAALAGLAAQGDAKVRALAIKALADRDDKSAMPALLKFVNESDRAVAGAAAAALGKLGTDREFEELTKLALAGKTPGADAALQAVASRVGDKPAAAGKLIALSQTAQPQQMPFLFETLAVLGGEEALAAISQSASSENEEVKDAAIRALANWPDFSAVKPLLVIAADSHAKRVHSLLAIRAVARLVRSSDKEPVGSRLEAAQAAMKAATRNEEKKLILSAFAAVPDGKAAEALKPFLNQPQLRTEAGLAALSLSKALLKTDSPAAKDLARAVKEAKISQDLNRKADALLKK